MAQKTGNYVQALEGGQNVTPVYIPNQGSMILQAAVGFTSADQELFHGIGGIAFYMHTKGGFGLDSITSDISATLLCDKGTAPAAAPIAGTGHLLIGIAEPTFQLTSALTIDIADNIITGGGTLAILITKDTDYIKIGTPYAPNYLALNFPGIGNIAKVSSYFEAGTSVDPVPPPDPNIYSGPYTPAPPSHQGVRFGQTLSINPPELDFLFLYIKITAGIGYDLALEHLNPSPACTITGFHNWYAFGQIYAGLTGDLGIDVDLWFYHGRYDIGSLGVQALLEGGLPNPTWFSGYVQIDYSAFNGAISGSKSFQVNLGQQADPGAITSCFSTNPKDLLSQALVKSVYPANGSIVPVSSFFEAKFSYSMEKEFMICDTTSSTNNIYSFELNIKQLTVTAQPQTNKVPNQNPFQQSNPTPVVVADYNQIKQSNSNYTGYTDQPYNTDMVMRFPNGLLGSTNYNALLEVTATQFSNGAANIIKDTTINIGFTTADVPLAEQLIGNPQFQLGAYPIPNQRYFLQNEVRQGCIYFKGGYSITPNNTHGGLFAVIKAIKNNQVIAGPFTIALPKTLSGSNSLDYNLPPLPNDCLIKAEFHEMDTTSTVIDDGGGSITGPGSSGPGSPLTPGQMEGPGGLFTQGEMQTFFSQRNPTNSSINYAAPGINRQRNVETNTQTHTPNGNIQTVVANPVKLPQRLPHNPNIPTQDTYDTIISVSDNLIYSYYFHTSKYNTLKDKVASLLTTSTSQSLPGELWVNMQGEEGFDVFDAGGSASTDEESPAFTMPLVQLWEDATKLNQWTQNEAIPKVYQMYANNNIGVEGVRNAGDYGNYLVSALQTNRPCTNGLCIPQSPVEFVNPDPALSDAEISADDASYAPPANRKYIKQKGNANFTTPHLNGYNISSLPAQIATPYKPTTPLKQLNPTVVLPGGGTQPGLGNIKQPAIGFNKFQIKYEIPLQVFTDGLLLKDTLNNLITQGASWLATAVGGPSLASKINAAQSTLNYLKANPVKPFNAAMPPFIFINAAYNTNIIFGLQYGNLLWGINSNGASPALMGTPETELNILKKSIVPL
jgi:hypothetical protein